MVGLDCGTDNKYMHTMQFGELYSHNLIIQIFMITLTALLSCDRCLTILRPDKDVFIVSSSWWD